MTYLFFLNIQKEKEKEIKYMTTGFSGGLSTCDRFVCIKCEIAVAVGGSGGRRAVGGRRWRRAGAGGARTATRGTQKPHTMDVFLESELALIGVATTDDSQ